MGLAEARNKAAKHRATLVAGVDPLVARAETEAKAAADAQASSIRGMTFRSVANSFLAAHEASWASPGELIEMALAHTVCDKVEAAYRRGDLFMQRGKLMQDWAAFCTPTPSSEYQLHSISKTFEGGGT